MKTLNSIKSLAALNIEIPQIEQDKEGHLKGGFTGITVPGIDLFAHNGVCDNGCRGRCGCPEEDTNDRCRDHCDSVCPPTGPTDPTDPTKPTEESKNLSGMAGFFLLF